ncbi:ROK family protein [Bacillus fonticola]|uniref:ROK family protein n=1 Tax=Bacillus fonticola TaxID=2728853 RepID=UPI001472962D|nr:ROK family protein [Bacillus fonticola]
MRLGAIEAGGTKFVCAIGDVDGKIEKRMQFPTTTPEETLLAVREFFANETVDAVGIGSFGPIDVNRTSKTYGYVTTTPKAGWSNFPFLQAVKEIVGAPVGFTTDVNAAALGELTLGAAQGAGSCLYVTVGTGIGGGAVMKGELLEGITHPEMGHIRVRRHEQDTYAGNCPYHSDCLEGLAAGPAIEKRWGQKGSQLVDRPEVWETEAHYLGEAVATWILTLSPERIVLGGGVMKQRQLLPLIHKHVKEALNGYVSFEAYTSKIEETIVSPGLGDDAGITGCLLLAERARKKGRSS